MNHQLFQKYVREYAQAALAAGGDRVAGGLDYLLEQPRPGLFARDRAEKRAALERVLNVFRASRERSWYVALKSLGLDDLAKQKL